MWKVRALAVVNVAYAALLVAASIVPPSAVQIQSISDTASHGLAYGLQAVLLFALLVGRRAAPGRAAVAAVAGATLFGAFTESIQSVLATRSAEWHDLLADALGAGVGVALGLVTHALATRCSRGSAP
jgi:VanZ family protein